MKLSLISVLENVAEKQKDGSMVAFFVSKNLIQNIHSLFEDIPGDFVSPEDAHITLGLVHNYSGGNTSKIKSILNKFCAYWKPFECSIDSFGVFPPTEGSEGKYILYAKPKAEEIQEIHSRLLPIMKKYKINIDNGDFKFSPHITIKYCDEQPIIKDKLIHEKFYIDSIYFVVNNKKYRAGLG